MIQCRIVKLPSEKSAIAENILRKLPDWFGIESSLANYVREVADMYFLCAYSDHAPVGFLAINEHFPCTCEIHVMGILPEFHRKGIGRELVLRAASRYADKGFSFMTVKTVAAPQGGEEYALTRAFYGAMGFLPLEVFPTLWDEHNPCLLMCKTLAAKVSPAALPDSAN